MEDVDALSDGEAANCMQDVVLLSDDEAIVPAPQQPDNRLKRKSSVDLRDISLATNRLKNIVQSNCKCKKQGQCRAPWREPAEFEKILQLRLRLHSMEKAQCDREALIPFFWLCETTMCLPQFFCCTTFSSDKAGNV